MEKLIIINTLRFVLAVSFDFFISILQIIQRFILVVFVLFKNNNKIFANGLSYIPEKCMNFTLQDNLFSSSHFDSTQRQRKKCTLFLKFNSLAFILIPTFYNNLTSLIAGLVLTFFRFEDSQFCCWSDLSWITKILKACLIDNVSRIFDFFNKSAINQFSHGVKSFLCVAAGLLQLVVAKLAVTTMWCCSWLVASSGRAAGCRRCVSQSLLSQLGGLLQLWSDETSTGNRILC